MNINELTLGQIKEIQALGLGATASRSPFEVGKCYLIRTVTMAWTGRVESIQDGFLVLSDAAWIADTGRFNEAIATGKLNEVEPVFEPAIIGLGSIVDATAWKHDLPRAVK